MVSYHDLKDNPRGSTAFATSASLLILAGLAVFTRLYTRFVIVKTPGLDDALITTAWIFSAVLTGTIAGRKHYQCL